MYNVIYGKVKKDFKKKVQQSKKRKKTKKSRRKKKRIIGNLIKKRTLRKGKQLCSHVNFFCHHFKLLCSVFFELLTYFTNNHIH